MPRPRARTAPSRALTRSRSTDEEDRKSTRLNSSHDQISYAVFCLKKKKKRKNRSHDRNRCRLVGSHVLRITTRLYLRPHVCSRTLRCRPRVALWVLALNRLSDTSR